MSSDISIKDHWSGELAITGVGLITPVGFCADSSLAALRAGISRLSRLEHFKIEVNENELDFVLGAQVPWRQERSMSRDRISSLMEPVLSELFSKVKLEKSDRIGAFIGTSGTSPGGRILNYDEKLKEDFLDSVPKGYSISRARLIPAGRVSVLKAIRSAAISLTEDIIDVAIIGAADSLISPRSLSWLRSRGRLGEFPSRTGIFPAEAAGFLALEKIDRVRERNSDVLAIIRKSTGAFEEGTWGEAMSAIPLTKCIRSVTENLSDTDAFVVSDLGGERYRVMEWIMAMPKAMWRYQKMHHWNPADRIGDSGAAMGAISLAWAADAMRRRYSPSQNSLIWGASDEGYREAALVSVWDGE